MPRRRRLAGAISGAGQGLSQFLGTLLQSRLAQQQQQKSADQAMERQLVTQTSDDIRNLGPEFVREHGPQAAEEQFKALIARLSPEMRSSIAKPNFAGMDTPESERSAEALVESLKFEKPEDAPSREGVSAQLRRRRLDPEAKPFALNASELGFGFDPAPAKVESPDLMKILGEVERKSGAMSAEREKTRPVTGVPGIGPDGVGTTTYTKTHELPGVTTRTERTPGEEASRRGQIAEAEEQARTNVQNDPRNVQGFATREEALSFARGRGGLRADVQLGGAAAQARQAGSLRADAAAGAGDFAPQWDVREDVGPDGKKVYRVFDRRAVGQGSGQVATNVDAQETTDTQRRAAGFGLSAVEAHNRMTALEPVLMQRGYWQVRGALKLEELNAPQMIQDPAVRAYAQATREFINAGLGRPQSGATITPEDYDIYNRAYGFTPGMNADLMTNIQTSRRTALEGLQIQAGNLGQRIVNPKDLETVLADPVNAGRPREDVIKELEDAGYRVVR